MLLRSRASSIDSSPVAAAKGYEHVSVSSIAVMRWLGASGVDYVLVGPVARLLRRLPERLRTAPPWLPVPALLVTLAGVAALYWFLPPSHAITPTAAQIYTYLT